MIDLKELMEDRAAGQPSAGHLRLAQVHRKIKERRRRAMVATAVVVLLLLAGYRALPIDNAPIPEEPVAASPSPPPTMAAMPWFDQGRRLSVVDIGSVGDTSVSVQWSPSTLDFHVLAWGLCEPQEMTTMDTLPLALAIKINGMPFTASGCDGYAVGGHPADVNDWSRLGVKVGVPSVATVSWTGATTPEYLVLRIAIYEKVAAAQ